MERQKIQNEYNGKNTEPLDWLHYLFKAWNENEEMKRRRDYTFTIGSGFAICFQLFIHNISSPLLFVHLVMNNFGLEKKIISVYKSMSYIGWPSIYDNKILNLLNRFWKPRVISGHFHNPWILFTFVYESIQWIGRLLVCGQEINFLFLKLKVAQSLLNLGMAQGYKYGYPVIIELTSIVLLS